ncbi:MAG: CRISPR-associated protein Cas4 [Armatimonadetes bacterium]|nr:CRISPR-associated protein Cas4 [Armatimonadota bacterium]
MSMEPLTLPEETWHELAIRGYELNAWVICPRKCWFIQRQLMMEPHSPYVELGRLVHQEALQERPSREPTFTEVPIEGFARIDKIAGELVYEIKRSPRKQEAHRLQLLYYLYLLRERGLNLKGVLSYPEQNRREVIELDDEGIQALQNALQAIQQLRQCPLPPQVPRPMSVCRTCAYQELCWCEEEEG